MSKKKLERQKACVLMRLSLNLQLDRNIFPKDSHDYDYMMMFQLTIVIHKMRINDVFLFIFMPLL